MCDCTVKTLVELAARFRTAIVQCNPVSLTITLRNFPHGACGDATLLLAKYLEENGCGKFDYVSGKRKDHGHAWLQRDGLIIDITADQFSDQDCPIFISKDNRWHSKFNGKVQHIADLTLYDNFTVAELCKSYKEIINCIKP